ncbi:hypothetical protein HGQ17_05915 [Nesterenkonia sp. MY13]|uniref:Uncharacterized protein n=1 Tax=Nesterenkonia sedimenti TaxID=1463632 RepID=A0A7X8TIU5_9MICC|nr:hypothetical protein [Nesterenkonia sedimenti]NLS09552.1 hypothetical protein [Nesterenkonia sedimenti]
MATQLIGEKEKPLSDKALIAGVRRGLGPIRRFRVSSAQAASAITSKTLIHHPMWLAKILTFADRPPFPPKVRPNVAFVDAVSGYRGVMETVPPLWETTDDDASARQIKPKITTEEKAKPYVRAVLDKVDRSYMMKKPRHSIEELNLVYLPLWKVKLALPGAPEEMVINANTGEPETYLARQWSSTSWHTLD